MEFTPRDICIQICANNEWLAVKEILFKTNSDFSFSPFGECRRTTFENISCIFFHSGAGKTLSSAACQYAIDHWNPEFLIVIGTAAGIATEVKLHDIVIANKTVQYDCISRMGSETEFFYSDFITYVNNSWIDLNELSIPFITGLVASADQDVDPKTRADLMPHLVLAADWESGAIAPICKLNNIPFCIIRGISDIPGFDSQHSSDVQFDDFVKNTPLIMDKLINVVLPEIIRMWKKCNLG